MLQVIMNICRLQDLDVVTRGFGNFVSSQSSSEAEPNHSLELREKMAIELIQQKLLLRTPRDDKAMWLPRKTMIQ